MGKPSKKQRRVARQGSVGASFCHDRSTPLLRSRAREERGRRLDAPGSLWSECDWARLSDSMSVGTCFERQGESWTASFTFRVQQFGAAVQHLADAIGTARMNAASAAPARASAPGWLVGRNVGVLGVHPTMLGEPYVLHMPTDIPDAEYRQWRDRPVVCHTESADANVERDLIRQWLTNIPDVPVFCDCGHTFTVTPMRAPGGMAWCVRCRRRHDIFDKQVEPDFSPPVPPVQIVNPAFFQSLETRPLYAVQ